MRANRVSPQTLKFSDTVFTPATQQLLIYSALLSPGIHLRLRDEHHSRGAGPCLTSSTVSDSCEEMVLECISRKNVNNVSLVSYWIYLHF
jgi:hypothetical protein